MEKFNMEKESTEQIPFPKSEEKEVSDVDFYENEIKNLDNSRLQHLADANACAGAISALRMVVERIKVKK